MADRRPRTHKKRFLMGLGLDHDDGHSRVTRGEEYLLLGGSKETHEEMQDRVEDFRRELARRGTDLQQAGLEDMLDAARESGLA